jgi:hypothetical protein
MKVLKLIFFLAVPIVIFQYWYTHQPAKTASLPAVSGADPKQVVVFAPENCPSEDAQRSDAMARDLMNRSIPSLRSHDISFTSSDPDPAIQNRLNTVMNGELPIVIVNGKGKANPTLDQVVAEYMATP